jgi:hypothetical protein
MDAAPHHARRPHLPYRRRKSGRIHAVVATPR